jgi:hypothetical protein
MDDAGYEHDILHSNAYDAIEAIEAELGTDPAGGAATVKDRLDLLGVPSVPLRWPTAGLYYSTIRGQARVISTALTSGRITFMPFVPPTTVTATGLAVRVSSGQTAGTNVRLGIYSNNYSSSSGHRPQDLLLDAGTVSTATLGLKVVSVSQELIANTIYWMACVGDNNNVILTTHSTTNNACGLSRNSTAYTPGTYYKTATYAPLPASAGELSDLTIVATPIVWVKL